MKISEHILRSKKVTGLAAEDIHKWIDGYFDADGFADFLRNGQTHAFDPYDHRKHRHCREALQDAYREFEGKYTREQIKAVFECHIRDDYGGYIPSRLDFTNGTFAEKYHENDEHTTAETILSTRELEDYFQGRQYANHRQQDAVRGRGFLWRIVIPTVLAIILFVTSFFVIIVPMFRKSMMQRKQEMIRELTSAAASPGP